MAVGQANSDSTAAAFISTFDALHITNLAHNASNWRVQVAPLAPGPKQSRVAAPGLASTLAASLYVPHYKKILTREVNGSSLAMPPPGALVLQWDSGKHATFTPANFSAV